METSVKKLKKYKKLTQNYFLKKKKKNKNKNQPKLMRK